MPAPAPFTPPPRWVWRPDAHTEPSTPIHSTEDGAWAAALTAAPALVAGWWLQHHPWPLAPWLYSPAGIATAAGAAALGAAAGWLAVRTPHDRICHLAGPRLLEGHAAERGAVAWSRAQGGTERNTRLHPRVPLPDRQWARHMLVHGSVGSGKTQILASVVRQVSADARSRLLLADSKGDWTAMLPDAALLCPWDARSAVWAIADEIRSPADCASVAQALIPEHPDPKARFWTATSRAVVEAALRTLHTERSAAWGWRELRDVLRMPAKQIVETCQRHHPEIAQVLGGGETTSGGVLATVAADTRLVAVCAQAWPEVPQDTAQRWSVRHWLSRGCAGLPRHTVVQTGADQGASRALLGLVTTLTARRMLAPSMPESPERVRVWIVLDELAAAGRLDDLPALIERGRSKGVALLAGVQDLEQIAAIYGRETASGLSGMVGAQVVCQIGPGPSRDRVADLIGKRRVAVPAHSTQGGATGRTSHTKSVHEESRALVLPAQMSSCLGPWHNAGAGFVRALVLPSGADACVLDWPVIPLAVKRTPFVPAAWTRPGAKQPLMVDAPVTQPLASAASGGRVVDAVIRFPG